MSKLFSQTPTVYMASTAPDGDPVQVPINFADTHRTRLFLYEDFTGIWSCRFSADGNEVVAGGSGKIFGLYFNSNPLLHSP